MESIITVENLTKHFVDGNGQRLEILKAIDHEFPRNASISIVGSSGSGKSTLLNLMGGLDHPTSGNVFFLGENINQYDSDTLSDWRNRHVGFIFQAHHLLPDFTALENVSIPAMIAGSPRQQYLKKAEMLLDQVGLKERSTHKPSQLSGGEQQRVAIARALINSPSMVFADEPTGNLDNKTGESVGALLQEICRSQKTTLIVVTHNAGLATSMDFKLRLFDGKLSEF
ncbi:MAG: ABC transporter ATP-binding protein [Deltaproteobacteria bacterium]|jgi:lipoprotein-releasing system ATP-binding protein|nr:ABC transporter ATP-binding protein [Deltaproteobacteria bacterium]MBT4090353.1 ABC transporter ATP-binding protein [Deltaproteobacteria bacterium]MBT4268052.1 ABC transporter ATP-binding protein [Deltaproteobacteria bacterium]MBT4641480.1 ABC transporter ATP-binding protein [Deltaproteobacteria bacterium]MBT6500095.1 ABC transporter ATP-binding protein [Deltaproteobacteria bacterium]